MEKIKDIKFWIFDLDNTLYPSSTNLFSGIDKLMASFITQHLNVNHEEALQIKNDYFQKHGTTLNGLIKHHNIDPHHFLEFVHNIDYSFLSKNEKLNKEIKSLPGKKIIFTNGSKKHANNVISNLQHNFSLVACRNKYLRTHQLKLKLGARGSRHFRKRVSHRSCSMG